MQVVPDDVLTGVTAAWNASTLPELVPGKLWHGRAETGAEMPYGTAKVIEGAREEFTGSTYLQKFEVELSVWSNTTPPNTGLIRRGMARLFDRTTSLSVPNATAVVHVRALGGKLEHDNRQRDALDVLLATGRWEVLIQATRENDP